MSQITVSGHLFNLSGSATAGSVTFLLTNYGDNQPRVIGTNAIAPINVTAQADATGAWSIAIQGNDTIDPGAANTPPTTYYSVTFADANGKVIQSLPFNFTGAGPNNLDSQAPLVTFPSPTVPPNNAALLAANQTFTGNNTFSGTTTLGTVAGNVAFTGNPTIAGTIAVTGLARFTGGISPDGTHTETIPANTSTLVDLSATQTLTSKTLTSPTITGATLTTSTLTSPIINGSPTGTGIPTITLKKGSGSGTYQTASQSYVDVDAANLAYTVTIPTGWKLAIQVSGQIWSATAVAGVSFALFDSSVIVEGATTPSNATFQQPFSLSWVIAGDGASHTIKLQYKTAVAADVAQIANTSATLLPTMVFILSPSN